MKHKKFNLDLFWNLKISEIKKKIKINNLFDFFLAFILKKKLKLKNLKNIQSLQRIKM